MIRKILLDTNILIKREDNEPLTEPLQKLLELLTNDNYQIYVHPASFEDIMHDSNEKRRRTTSSKLKSYKKLKNPPKFDDDEDFKNLIKINKKNDYIDNLLLYSLFKGKVDFLITEDLEIHKTAKKFNLEEQVLTINEALITLDIKLPYKPTTIKKTTVDTLDLNNPIFDTLKEDYEVFEDWFNKIAKSERDCLTYTEKGKLGALLIYKAENETIPLSNKILPPKERIKIATMVVSSTGNKIGEFFISWIVNYAINLGCEELYLTHYTKENDYLVYLIEEYGFKNVGKNDGGEEVFIKIINKKTILAEINETKDSFSNIAKNIIHINAMTKM